MRPPAAPGERTAADDASKSLIFLGFSPDRPRRPSADASRSSGGCICVVYSRLESVIADTSCNMLCAHDLR